MMNELLNLRVAVKEKFLLTQRICRYIHEDKFEDIFNTCSSELKAKIMEAVQKLDKNQLLKLVKVAIEDSYESYNVGDLRILGKRLGIPYYYSLPKDSLLSEIAKRERIT